jgi:hypothetical protein
MPTARSDFMLKAKSIIKYDAELLPGVRRRIQSMMLIKHNGLIEGRRKLQFNESS